MKKVLSLVLFAIMGLSLLQAQETPALKIGVAPHFTGSGDLWGTMIRGDYEHPLGNRFFTSVGIRAFSSANLESSERYSSYQSVAADLSMGVKIIKTSSFTLQAFGGVSFANMSSLSYAGFTTEFTTQGEPIRIPFDPNRRQELGIGWTAGVEANVIFDGYLLGIRPNLQVYDNGDNLIGAALIFGLTR